MEFKDINDIRNCIKQNPPTDFYPDPDDFDDYEEYANAYDNEKQNYMKYISNILKFGSIDKMLNAIYPDNPEDAEYELFEFFYDDMVKEDYFDMDDYSDDDDYYEDNDYYGSDDYDY